MHNIIRKLRRGCLAALLLAALLLTAATAAEMTKLVFSDDFSDASISTNLWSNVTVENGQGRVDRGKTVNLLNHTFSDAVYEFSLCSQGGTHWTGFLFHRADPSHTWDNSGYLLYLRSGTEEGTTAGAVDLMRGGAGDVRQNLETAQIEGYQPGDMVDFRVEISQGTIQVFANGQELMTVQDSTYTSGYAGFWCSGTQGYGLIDNVSVKTAPPQADSEDTIEATFAELTEALEKAEVYMDDTGISHLPMMLREGYGYEMVESSDSSVIAVTQAAPVRLAPQSDFARLNGSVTPPGQDTDVTVTWKLTYTFEGTEKASQKVETTYRVPACTTAADTAHFLDEKYGLFVHYVWTGSPSGNQSVHAMTPDGTKAATIDEMIEKFDAEQFARDCKDWGMQYVIFTVWHYQTNPVYPSEVYKDWRDPGEGNKNLPTDDGQHDLIEKLYQALSAQGVDLYLYNPSL